MTKREAIHKELSALYKEGAKLAVAFQKQEDKQFQYDYQRWWVLPRLRRSRRGCAR